MTNKKLEPVIQANLFKLMFLVKEHMKNIVKDGDAELSPMQILTLRILTEEGETSQAQLVKKLGRNKSQVTRLIQELEKKGLIIKERNQSDGRSFMLTTIPDVKNKVSSFILHEKKLVSKMLQGVSESDRQRLNTLLIQMKNSLKNDKNT